MPWCYIYFGADPGLAVPGVEEVLIVVAYGFLEELWGILAITVFTEPELTFAEFNLC